MSRFNQILLWGMLGVGARFGLDEFFPAKPDRFPISTFGINILGSFLIGIVYVLAVEKHILSSTISRALMAGFLGGFTTFSAYSIQSITLLSSGFNLKGVLYFIGSPILGVFSALLGILLTRTII